MLQTYVRISGTLESGTHSPVRLTPENFILVRSRDDYVLQSDELCQLFRWFDFQEEDDKTGAKS
jgi:hypothetical protein